MKRSLDHFVPSTLASLSLLGAGLASCSVTDTRSMYAEFTRVKNDSVIFGDFTELGAVITAKFLNFSVTSHRFCL